MNPEETSHCTFWPVSSQLSSGSVANLHWMSSGSLQTLSNFSQSPPVLSMLGWFSLIQSDQKQHTLGVIEDGVVEEMVVAVLGMGVGVVLVVLVTGVVEGGKEDEGGEVGWQMLKCFSTVPLGPQITQ